MATVIAETVVWDNSKLFIENVLKNIQNYVDAQAFRGGDKHRLDKMRELRLLAETARQTHNYLAVQEKAKAMLDTDITPFGFWGGLSKASFSYKILQAIAHANLTDQEQQQQVTPLISEVLKRLHLKNSELQAEIAKITEETQKTALLKEALDNKQREITTLEYNITQLTQEKKSMVANNMLLQAENSRLIALKIDLNELQIAYQQLVTDHKVLRSQLAEVTDLKQEKSELERKTLRLATEIKLLRNHINDQGQLDATNYEQLATANAKIAQLQTIVTEQDHKISAMQSKDSTVNLQQRLLAAKASELKKQQATQESATSLVPILKEMIDAAAIDNDALRKQLQQKEAKITELLAVNKTHMDYYQRQVDTLHRDLKQRDVKINHLQSFIQSLTNFLRKAIGLVEDSHKQKELTKELTAMAGLPTASKATRSPRYPRVAFIASINADVSTNAPVHASVLKP